MIKIAIIGPESTGKTELTKGLAKHFGGGWFPELAREYIENKNYQYSFEDVENIARMQIEEENSKECKGSRNICFYDTDVIITKVWFEHKYNQVPNFVTNHLESRVIDFYILCLPDLPWEDDPVRENRDLRSFFFDWYQREIENLGTAYAVVGGFGNERLKNAVDAIEKYFYESKNISEMKAHCEESIEKLINLENLPKFTDRYKKAFTMPSIDIIEEIVKLLRSMLFPGFFGQSHQTKEALQKQIEENTYLLYERLKEQIKAGICFESNDNNQICDELDETTEEIVKKFINSLPHLRRQLYNDAMATYNGDPAAKSLSEIIYCYPGIRAISSYRIAHELLKLGVPILPRAIAELAHSETGIDIHPGATIGESFMIDHGTGVVIGETAKIGNGVKIYQGVTLGAKSFPMDENGNPIKGIDRHPKLGDGVIVYSNSTLLGNISVGNHAIIGGNLWVDHDVEANSRILQRK